MTRQDRPEKYFAKWRQHGWIPEPDSLKILAQGGMEVVKHCLASTPDEAKMFARRNGFPVVAKVVSPAIVHKSDVGGVATGLASEAELDEQFKRFRQLEGFAGMLVAEMLSGVELIVGAKKDRQFGTVILLGIGGTGVELYGDVVIRMAPLTRDDVKAMADGLKGRRLLGGFRQHPEISMEKLADAVVAFSELVMQYSERLASADINPLICSAERCVVADARFILPEKD